MGNKKSLLSASIGASLDANTEKNVVKKSEPLKYIKVDPRKLEDFPLQHETYGDFEDREDYDEFMASIEVNGILEPVMIRVLDNGNYGLIAGHGRKYGAIKKNIREIDAYIREFKTEDDAILAFDITNNDRKNLTTTQLATVCQRTHDIYVKKRKNGEIPELSGIRIADIVAKQMEKHGIGSGKKVRNLLKLNKLIEPLKKLIDDKTLSQQLGISMSQLSEEEQQQWYDAVGKNIGQIQANQFEDYKTAMSTNLQNRDTKIQQLEKEKDELAKQLKNSDGMSEDDKNILKGKIEANDKKIVAFSEQIKNKDKTILALQEEVRKAKETDITKTPEFEQKLKERDEHYLEKLKLRKDEINDLKNTNLKRFTPEISIAIEKSVSDVMISLKHINEYFKQLKEKGLLECKFTDPLKEVRDYIDNEIL